MQNDHFAADVLDVLAQMKRVQGNFAEQAANSRAEARLTSVEKVDGMASTRGSYERALAYADSSVQMLAAIGHMKEVLAYREGSEDERTEHAERNAPTRDAALSDILATITAKTGMSTFDDGQCVVNDGEAQIAGSPFIGYFAGVEIIATVMVPNEETGRLDPYRAPIEHLRAANEQEKARVDNYHPFHTDAGNLSPEALRSAQDLDSLAVAHADATPVAPLKRWVPEGPFVKRGPIEYNLPIPQIPNPAADELTVHEQAAPDTQATYSGYSSESIRITPLTGDAATAAAVGAAHPELPSYTEHERPERGDRVVAWTDAATPQMITGEYVGLNGDLDPVVRTDNGMEWPVKNETIQPANRRAE